MRKSPSESRSIRQSVMHCLDWIVLARLASDVWDTECGSWHPAADHGGWDHWILSTSSRRDGDHCDVLTAQIPEVSFSWLYTHTMPYWVRNLAISKGFMSGRCLETVPRTAFTCMFNTGCHCASTIASTCSRYSTSDVTGTTRHTVYFDLIKKPQRGDRYHLDD